LRTIASREFAEVFETQAEAIAAIGAKIQDEFCAGIDFSVENAR
jgi:hypothetical protein